MSHPTKSPTALEQFALRLDSNEGIDAQLVFDVLLEMAARINELYDASNQGDELLLQLIKQCHPELMRRVRRVDE